MGHPLVVWVIGVAADSGGAARPPLGGDDSASSQPTPSDGLLSAGARPPSRRPRRPPSPASGRLLLLLLRAARCFRGESRCNFASPLASIGSLPPTLHRLLESTPAMHSSQAQGKFSFAYAVGLSLSLYQVVHIIRGLFSRSCEASPLK